MQTGYTGTRQRRLRIYILEQFLHTFITTSEAFDKQRKTHRELPLTGTLNIWGFSILLKGTLESSAPFPMINISRTFHLFSEFFCSVLAKTLSSFCWTEPFKAAC